jgi:hypothetical protein
MIPPMAQVSDTDTDAAPAPARRRAASRRRRRGLEIAGLILGIAAGVGVAVGCKPMALYTNTVTLPRFVAVPLAAFGPAAQVRSVRSGPPDDPGSRGGTPRSGSTRGACGTAARTYPP